MYCGKREKKYKSCACFPAVLTNVYSREETRRSEINLTLLPCFEAPREKQRGKTVSLQGILVSKEVGVRCRNTMTGLIIFQVKENFTSCSLSSLSCTSFFTKSATNRTQAIISMSGKTKEMASRYLGEYRGASCQSNFQNIYHPITVNNGRWNGLSFSHGLDRDGDAEGGRAISKRFFWQLCSHPRIIYAK